MTATLEQRIASAMTAPITSADLSSLISDVETGLAKATADAQEAARSALDITKSVDGRLAFEKAQEHDFISKRLKVTLPKLQERLIEVLNAERCAAWIAECNEMRVHRDNARKILNERLPQLVAELVEHLQTITTIERAVSDLNVRSPGIAGYHLDAVDPAKLIAKFVVAALQQGGKPLWPPRNAAALAAMFAPIDAGPAYGPYWPEVVAERQRQLLKIAEENASR